MRHRKIDKKPIKRKILSSIALGTAIIDRHIDTAHAKNIPTVEISTELVIQFKYCFLPAATCRIFIDDAVMLPQKN